MNANLYNVNRTLYNRVVRNLVVVGFSVNTLGESWTLTSRFFIPHYLPEPTTQSQKDV